MDYKLPDGRMVNLAKISDVSTIRDYGLDENTIDKSTLSFTIRLKNGYSIQVNKQYHYADWNDAILELKATRNDLMEKFKEFKDKPE